MESMAYTSKAKGKTDEWFTPRYAIEPIADFVPKGAVVWCPFDTEESEFVKVFRKRGLSVIATHIKDGIDFFSSEVPSGVTHIISNPPYSRRNDVLERLYKIGLPFAMLLSSLGICEGRRYVQYKQNGVQFLIPSRRVDYINGESGEVGSVAFQSWYVCWKMLPKDIVFVDIKRI